MQAMLLSVHVFVAVHSAAQMRSCALVSAIQRSEGRPQEPLERQAVQKGMSMVGVTHAPVLWLHVVLEGQTSPLQQFGFSQFPRRQISPVWHATVGHLSGRQTSLVQVHLSGQGRPVPQDCGLARQSLMLPKSWQISSCPQSSFALRQGRAQTELPAGHSTHVKLFSQGAASQASPSLFPLFLGTQAPVVSLMN